MKNTLSDRLNRITFFWNLVIYDTKNILRDKTLIFIALVPVIFIGLIRFGLPIVNDLLPESLEYNRTIFSLFFLLTVFFPSFIVSMVMIDEKDEDVITVFRITPLSSITFTVYRLTFVYFFSFFWAVVFYSSAGLAHVSFYKIIYSGFLVSLISPITVLAILGFASNKIVAVTIFKVLGFVLFLPILSVIFDFQMEKLLAVVPVYWTFHLINELESQTALLHWFLPGIFVHLLYIVVLYKRFSKVFF